MDVMPETLRQLRQEMYFIIAQIVFYIIGNFFLILYIANDNAKLQRVKNQEKRKNMTDNERKAKDDIEN